MPPSDIDALVASFNLPLTQVDHLAAQLRARAPDWEDFPVKNSDGVPTLFFAADTPTESSRLWWMWLYGGCATSAATSTAYATQNQGWHCSPSGSE